jgi:molybdopterin synthase catalytic subunit
LFRLTDKTIDVESLRREMNSDEAGAFVCFEGRVRNFNDGKAVSSLEYEAYEALALKEANKIMEEARALFPIIAVTCVHRVGPLEIGGIAVWVGVLSRHRGEGFDACRYVIDQVKARVPIWKKEFYADGTTSWVNCAECAQHADHNGKQEAHVGADCP